MYAQNSKNAERLYVCASKYLNLGIFAFTQFFNNVLAACKKGQEFLRV